MKTKILSALGSAALVSGGATALTCVGLPATPALAIPVFDASNYAQNILTAARTLTSINNQIQSLQNEAQMLINQGKNLARVDFPQLQELQAKLQEIDRLMGQAQGIDFKVGSLDRQFESLFPQDFTALGTRSQRLTSARAQLEAAMGSFRQTMSIQSQIAENVEGDARTLAAIVSRSQGAEGSLAVSQATNQLLALTTKQQFQIQNLMASQFRAEALEQARRGQIERQARDATARFLGDGKAYSPRN
ncbi:P-type conjugative transfer protein TrbJ [Novosphingobium sp. JCM 18896]|uniref:P-type conjugative transfer protein TrbJ n=1 Tax=Novosphingobium sp. JCM 18896 TaxID=2989731 RepID=UPI002222D2BF|nr:P-type conjugative transfer protein TrbJ [Novosphingobium sp. JCM 18896]MCW1430913.1 P-type conjugative transfer protein TrbJ [Novosphingobium sp. JCM 18896]